MILLLSLPGLIAGVGLLQNLQWARILTLELAVLDLLVMPIGTIFGIYTIWVLVQEEVAMMFTSKASG